MFRTVLNAVSNQDFSNKFTKVLNTVDIEGRSISLFSGPELSQSTEL